MVLEASCHVSQDESTTINECDAISLEVGQNQESEKKNTWIESVVTTMETDSPGVKDMALLPHVEVETSNFNFVGVPTQNSEENIFSMWQVMKHNSREILGEWCFPFNYGW